MAEDTQSSADWGHLSLLSLMASLLGSAVAAIIFAAINAPQNLFPWVLIFLYGALFVTIPVGLILGVPLLALTGRFLPQHVTFATFTFGVIGLLGGYLLPIFDQAGLVFGSCVGVLHPLVYSQAKGMRWRQALAPILLTATAVPLIPHVAEDVSNLFESKSEFETRCADLYGSMAVFRDRADWKSADEPVRVAGKWRNQLKWRSLYEREDILPINKTQVLIARDYAYVPSGFGGWITGGRRVARHCLSEKKGQEAEMLRARRFGKRPDLKDLAD